MRLIQHVGTNQNGYWRVTPLNKAQLNQLMGIPPQLAQRFDVIRHKSHSTRVHEDATKVHNTPSKVHKLASEVHNSSTKVHNANYDDHFTLLIDY